MPFDVSLLTPFDQTVIHVDTDFTPCQDHKADLVIVTHVDIDLTGCQDHKPDWVPCFGYCYTC